jgi:hypothetical protein
MKYPALMAWMGRRRRELLSKGGRRKPVFVEVAASIDGGKQLCVQPSLGADHHLLLLATGRIGPVAVNFDVSGVDHADVLACTPIHLLHGRIPESILGPAAEVAIDGLPGRWRAGPR